MSTLTSQDWAYLLDPGLRAIFELQRNALAEVSRIPMLFNIASSNKAIEYDLSVGGMSDFDEYTGTIEYDSIDQGYRTAYEHVEYAKGFAVERKLFDDDLYNIIHSRARRLAVAAMRTREKHAASVFVNAFSASHPGGDGVSLCNDSHPASPANPSVTQSNAGTTALSYDAVVATRVLMRAYKDDRGELISVSPDLLLVPPQLESTANEIVNTFRGPNSQQPGTGNYGASIVQDSGIRYVVWDYLSDANNWFLIDSQLARLYLNWFDRVPLELAIDPTGDFNLVAKWRAYMRYSYGWSDWRWVYGHEVT